MSTAEYYTYLFYTWESRGRGWYVFDKPVYLEPPFIPFVRYYPRSGYIDESKRPTLISSFIDSIKGKKHPKFEQYEEVLDYENIEPFVYDAPLEFKAVQIKLPKHRKISPETMRAFLTMLSNSKFNFSFELIGNKNAIIFQFVCHPFDVDMLKTFLKSYFPDFTIIEDNTYLHLLPSDINFHCVDFGLNEEFVRPIAILKNYTLDPLTGIIGILDSLKQDEWAGIQILFQGAVNHWSQSIMHSVTASDGKSFFQDMSDAPKLAQEKISSPLFGVTIRTFSHEKENQYTIIENLSNVVIQGSKGMYNQLIALENYGYNGEARMNDLFLRQSHRLGMLLSADELATLLHFPSESIVSKKLFHTPRKTIEVPTIAQNKKTILGQNTHNSIITDVTYNIDARLKHTHIIGATGTGKSTLLAQQILQDIEQGIGIALFDPHGDLVDDVIARLPENSLHRIIIIDPSDTEYPIGLNILHAHNDLEKEVLSSDLVASFRRLSTSWGDQMNTVFANAILAILESTEGGTLNDLRRFLVEPQFRNSFLKNITDPSILYYWLKEYPLLKTNSIGPILTRLDTFLRPRIIRNMVSQKTGLDFEEILNGSKILFVKLPQGLIGKENSFLLGSLILSKLHQAAFARQAKQNRPPFFIYLDEFHNFITPSIKEMLSGVRKYNVGLVLSHQDLQQLQREDTELLNSVLGNTYTRIVFRVGEPDAKKLQDGFADFDFTDMQNLGRGEAILRIEQPKYNTSFDTNALSSIDAESKEQLYHIALSVSRTKYSKPKNEIEKEILSSLQLDHSVVSKKEEKPVVAKPKINKEDEVIIVEQEAIEPLVVNNDKEEESIESKPIVPELLEHFENPDETPIPSMMKVKERKEEISETESVHTYLKLLVKKIAENKNYKVTIEYGIQQGSIDVLCERNTERIAIEISVTTDPVWEVHNLQKCIGLGFSKIISLTGDKKHLIKIEKKCKELIPDYTTHAICFLTPDQLYTELTEPDIPNVPEVTIQKGYRVSVSYGEDAVHSSPQLRKNVAKTIVSAIRKKEKK